MHENITRNHTCQSIDELVDLTIARIEQRGPLQIEGAMYERLKNAARALSLLGGRISHCPDV